MTERKTHPAQKRITSFWPAASNSISSPAASACGPPQTGVVGAEEEDVVGTVTGCSPRSRDVGSSGGVGLFLWASSFSVSWLCSSFSGSLHCHTQRSRMSQHAGERMRAELKTAPRILIIKYLHYFMIQGELLGFILRNLLEGQIKIWTFWRDRF